MFGDVNLRLSAAATIRTHKTQNAHSQFIVMFFPKICLLSNKKFTTIGER